LWRIAAILARIPSSAPKRGSSRFAATSNGGDSFLRDTEHFPL
jgi:hypothetical protein